jgi:hypothetical protein
MLGQIGYAITAYAFYIASKEGATGLTGTVTVRDESNTKIVDGSSFTEVGEGWYEYTLVAGSVDAAGDYKFTFHTTSDTVDQKDIPALYIVGRTWVENIDQALSTTQSNLQDGSETLQTIYDRLGVILNGGGTNETTITVNNGNSNPVSSVNVEIRDSGGNYKTSGDTNGSGIYNKARLDDGTYNVYLSKDGYTTSNPYTLTVSGDTSDTYVITAISVDPPAASENCRLYDYVSNQEDGTYPSSITAWAEIVALPYDYAGKLHRGNRVDGTYDSTTGLVYWDIVKGATVQIYIKDTYVRQSNITVPSTATARIADQ